jgi:hypothetical protein
MSLLPASREYWSEEKATKLQKKREAERNIWSAGRWRESRVKQQQARWCWDRSTLYSAHCLSQAIGCPWSAALMICKHINDSAFPVHYSLMMGMEKVVETLDFCSEFTWLFTQEVYIKKWVVLWFLAQWGTLFLVSVNIWTEVHCNEWAVLLFQK